MTTTLHWWLVPIGILVCGSVWACLVGSQKESGMFPMAPLFGAMIFIASVVTALAVCVGRWLK